MRNDRPQIGQLVEFSIATKAGPRTYRATVVGHRPNGRYGRSGWVETRDDKGFHRSVAPARCRIVDDGETDGNPPQPV